MQLELDPSCGETIGRACADAVRLAINKEYELATKNPGTDERVVVHFEFNGIDMYAKSDSEPTELAKLYTETMRAKAEAYANSPEGKAAALENERERQELQGKVNLLLLALPGCQTLDDLIAWLAQFAEPADRIGVNCNLPFVCEQLTKHGIVSRMWVDDEDVKHGRDKAKNAQYLLGQVLSCADGGMPPHPILGMWAKQWLKNDGILNGNDDT